jgi:lipopolysaccharide export system protein LptA
MTVLAVLAVVFLISSSGLGAEEKHPAKTPLDSKEPIQVVADRLEAFDAEKLVVFSGNAVAVQGDKVIKSDKISLYYKKEKSPAKTKPAKDFSPAGDLERIEARGHVTVTQGPKVVTGELAIYYQDEQKIVMTGNPLMRDGNNTIAGDRIVVFVNENRGVVERSDNKRVTATIYPGDKPEGKQKKEKKK